MNIETLKQEERQLWERLRQASDELDDLRTRWCRKSSELKSAKLKLEIRQEIQNEIDKKL